MEKTKILMPALLALLLTGCAANTVHTPAVAAPPGLEQSATFVVRAGEALRLAAGGSGTGTMIFNGWEYNLNVEQMTLEGTSGGDFEISGVFYNLENVDDVEGTFKPMSADFTAAGGLSGLWMKNENEVVAYANTVGQNVTMRLNAQGARVTLQ